MKFGVRFQTLLCLLLSLMLAVWMPMASTLLTWTELEETSDTNEPVDSEEKEGVEEVTLSESRKLTRRARRAMWLASHWNREVRSAFMSSGLQKPDSMLSGQVSFLGRCGPLHC